MAIRETITGHSRFARKPIQSARIVEEPETHFFQFMDYKVDVKPPDQIFYGMRRRVLASNVGQTLVGEAINESQATLTWMRFKLPLGLVTVNFSYIDEAQLEQEIEAQRPGLKTVEISDDGNEAKLDIRQEDGSMASFIVPTSPLVTPKFRPDGEPYS